MTTETDTLPLIRTKLQRPRLPGDLIPRRRLLDRLHAGSDRKLTLISAMAGSGKTTLLAQWLEECPQPSAWLSLDEHDNDRIAFLSHCIDGASAIFPTINSMTEPVDQAARVGMINHLNSLGLPFVSIECRSPPADREQSQQNDA